MEGHATAGKMGPGRLFYVVGASGAGKDSLIQYARDALDDGHAVVFAHRYITRPASARGENHVALTVQEFGLRKRCGLFALDWESHGFSYALGIEIDEWMSKGLTVVVNGSRSHIPIARARYPDLVVIWVTASHRSRAERLNQRGRESDAEIAARLARIAHVDVEVARSALHIRNDGPLEAAGTRLVALLAGENPL
jgi:ribose 1,5-bisphosphokinase